MTSSKHLKYSLVYASRVLLLFDLGSYGVSWDLNLWRLHLPRLGFVQSFHHNLSETLKTKDLEALFRRSEGKENTSWQLLFALWMDQQEITTNAVVVKNKFCVGASEWRKGGSSSHIKASNEINFDIVWSGITNIQFPVISIHSAERTQIKFGRSSRIPIFVRILFKRPFLPLLISIGTEIFSVAIVNLSQETN